MDIHLKPCPHCGSDAKLNTITDDPEGPNHQGNYIACEACGASTQLMFSTGDDCRPILAQLWNARQGDGQHARDSAELRQLCQARDDETKARKAAEGLASELLAELITCRNDLARQAAELRQSVTVPGTDAILDEEDETLCEFEESRIARLDELIARAKGPN